MTVPSWFKHIKHIVNKIDKEREVIVMRQADKVKGRVIEGMRHPYPSHSVYDYMNIGADTPNQILKVQ